MLHDLMRGGDKAILQANPIERTINVAILGQEPGVGPDAFPDPPRDWARVFVPPAELPKVPVTFIHRELTNESIFVWGVQKARDRLLTTRT
jgi:hypothetical protein